MLTLVLSYDCACLQIGFILVIKCLNTLILIPLFPTFSQKILRIENLL